MSLTVFHYFSNMPDEMIIIVIELIVDVQRLGPKLMSLSRAKSIFTPANINSIVLTQENLFRVVTKLFVSST